MLSAAAVTAAICVPLSVPICVVVRLTIADVDSPEICAVDRYAAVRPSSTVDGIAFSCDVVRPCVCAVVSALSCVVDRLLNPVVLNPPICVAVKAPDCVVVRP